MNPIQDHKCGVCAVPTFERNNYFYGKLLTARDSIQEQFFFDEKRRLINRMVLGWGVVCGLNVEWDAGTREFVVSEGLALDCCGREILVCGKARIPFDKYEAHCGCEGQKQEPPPGRYILCLEYKECKIESVVLPPLSCSDQERQECNRIAEGFRLKFKEWEKDKKPEEVCLGSVCGCGNLPCLDRFKKPMDKITDPVGCNTQTIHDYLCERSRKGCPKCECCDCVVLGVVYVGKHDEMPPTCKLQKPDQQQKPEAPPVVIDTCTYRRLVYGNTLLYDLIDCHHGDLPHIVDYSWRTFIHPKRELHPEDFLKMLQGGLTFTFDQEMDSESLNGNTILVTVLRYDKAPNLLLSGRIRAQSVECKTMGGCFTATWYPDLEFMEELKRSHEDFGRDGGAQVEIQVRGSRVWSKECRKALDGEFIGDKLPTGNGVQGGNFIDWFVLRNECRKKSETQVKGYEAF